MQKDYREVGGSYWKRGEDRGLRAKCPFFFLLPLVKQRGGGAARAPIPAVQGAGAARREGKRERESRGIDSPTHHVLGRREEAGPRGPAAAGGGDCGGGAMG